MLTLDYAPELFDYPANEKISEVYDDSHYKNVQTWERATVLSYLMAQKQDRALRDWGDLRPCERQAWRTIFHDVGVKVSNLASTPIGYGSEKDPAWLAFRDTAYQLLSLTSKDLGKLLQRFDAPPTT